MIKSIAEMPVVYTCFAYRPEYIEELEGMLATIKEHHPQWPIVVGRGPVAGFDLPTLEVESPSGKCHWTLPVSLNLDDSENDWRKITRMKAWWIEQVWRNFEGLTGEGNRVLWIDADARLNGPLDIELDPQAEILAGPWWVDSESSDYDIICSGFLLFQGAKNGPVEKIIDQWSKTCLGHIQDLPTPSVPWPDGDQDVLKEVLKSHPDSGKDYTLLKLEHDKYNAMPNRDGTLKPGALVDQWILSKKMKRPEDRALNWPPAEEHRRRPAK